MLTNHSTKMAVLRSPYKQEMMQGHQRIGCVLYTGSFAFFQLVSCSVMQTKGYFPSNQQNGLNHPVQSSVSMTCLYECVQHVPLHHVIRAKHFPKRAIEYTQDDKQKMRALFDLPLNSRTYEPFPTKAYLILLLYHNNILSLSCLKRLFFHARASQL